MTRLNTRAVLGLAIVVGLWGCGGGNNGGTDGGDDGGVTDSGGGDSSMTTDSGPDDSGPSDSGPGDSGPDDSGPGDSGMMTDSGMMDGGMTDGATDSGMTDSGMTDSGMTDSGMTDSGMTDSGMADSGMADSGTTTAATPAAGEIIITEIMQNPATLLDADGEWFEIHNPSATVSYELMGCVVEGMTDAGIMLDTTLVIAPGAYMTFARSMDPGFTPDVVWTAGSYSLTNSSDLVRLSCPDGASAMTTVDEVVYDGGPSFPDPTGMSMQLDNTHLDATQNDVGANWCEGMTSYNGDLGTPGAANEACPSYTVGFCRLQSPPSIDATEGSVTTVFGRLFVSGLTDLTTGNDTSPQVRAMVGVGPSGSDPATDATWVWNTAMPNPGYPGTSAEANNDEYMGDLTTLPAVGGAATNYDYAYRFSADRGVTWTYCDTTDVGSPDGYIIADAGHMTAQPAAPVVATLIFSEYVEGSGAGNKALEITNIGTTPADLSTCSVNLYRNGSTTAGATIPLSGILTTDLLTGGSSLVLCNTGISDSTNCDSLTGSVNHNGDDAYDLVCGTAVMDTFGKIGERPSGGWTDGPPVTISTQNQTLRRMCSVTTGDTNGADAFDPSVEWLGFPQDTLSDLGSYTCP